MDANIDWHSRKTLPERMKYMLDNELMCDVTFRVGPDQTPIQAHKYMLVSASPVFYSMFEGPMAEKGEVIIPDITSELFKVILEFIYTDDGDVNATNVMNLLYGAEKYMLPVLKDKCCSFLSSSIDTENACLVLQVAHNLNIEDLQKESVTYILRNPSKCFNTVHFLSLISDCVKLIIKSDDLRCREETVYNRTIEWARTKCEEKHLSITDKNIRQELGDLIHLIRFPLIKPEYFTDNLSYSTILTSDEKLNIFRSFHTKKSDLFPTKSRGNYVRISTEFRRGDFHIGNPHVCPEESDDCVDFRTNFGGVLSAVTVFGSRNYRGKHNVKLNILNGSDILGTTEMTLCSTAGQEMYRIPLANPVEVEQNFLYSIQLEMTGPLVFNGKDFATSVTIDDLLITFVKSHLPSLYTSEVQGQIPGLVFEPL